MEESELYYQATGSGTRFQSAELDPEDVGMRDFCKTEETAVLDFMEGRNRILVMGGMSSTSKTFILSNLAEERDLDFTDFHSVGKFTEATSRIGADAVVKAVLDERYKKNTGAKALILDEGMAGMLNDGSSGLREGMDEVIRKLLDIYPHVVIIGGGQQFTSDEQTERIAGVLPGDLTVETRSFLFKHPNNRQTADLLQRVKMGLDRARVGQENPEKLIHREIAEIMAEVFIKYFRISRRLLFGGGMLFNNPSDVSSVRDNLLTSIMPDECRQAAWEIQKQRILDRRDQLMAVIGRHSAGA